MYDRIRRTRRETQGNDELLAEAVTMNYVCPEKNGGELFGRCKKSLNTMMQKR